MDNKIIGISFFMFLLGVGISLSVVFLFNDSKHKTTKVKPVNVITPWSYDDTDESNVLDYKVQFNQWKRNVNLEEHKPIMPHMYMEDMVKKALDQFTVENKNYTLPGRKPLISIVTRAMKSRPKPLEMARNEHMVKGQFEYNFEHVLLTDEAPKGSGMQIAEVACHAFKSKFNGEYVCHIDDDDFITSFYFTKRMQEVIKQKRYKVIIFRMWHEELGRTQPKEWKKFPSYLSWMSTNNWLMRKDVYDAHVNVMSRGPQGADTRFIRNVLLDCNVDDVAWVNECFTTVPFNEEKDKIWEPLIPN